LGARTGSSVVRNPNPPQGKQAHHDLGLTVGAIGLGEGDVFGYWFDFGDSWWHQIDVLAIEDHAPPGDYPKVTERVGESPPQYPDWEEEDE
jgi:hypothetical protein